MSLSTAEELKHAFSKERMLLLGERLDLKRKGTKLQCPRRCSEKADCSVSEKDGVALYHCHRSSCGSAGSVIDLVMAVRGLSDGEAIAWLADYNGQIPDPPKKKKKIPFNAATAWEHLAGEDNLALEYLRGRGLEGAALAGLVKFNIGKLPNQKWMNERGQEGFRVAVRMYGVDGSLTHLQMRLVFPPREKQDTKMSTPGGYGSGVAMGDVAGAKTAGRVYLAEGIADTLALQLAGVVAIGAPGDSSLKNLPNFLGDAAGRQFVLCIQNDPRKQSEIGFTPVQRTLQAAGAQVLIMRAPAPHKDPADWLKAIGLPEFKKLITTALPIAPADSTAAPADSNVIQLAPPPTKDEADWQQAIAKSGLLRFGDSYGSVCLIIREDRHIFEERPIWNEMLCSPVVKGRVLEDHDTGRARELIELRHVDDSGEPIEVGAEKLESSIIQVAHERCVHPVRDYLTSLKWDGTPRIEHIAEDVLGVERTDMTQKMLRFWFIGTAKRPLHPGCKMDSVLVLAGPQYKGKSTFFSTLAGPPEWFSDDKVDIENRDSLMLLQAVWILEWAELATMKRAKDIETLKQFISSKTNKFRLPYGRRIIERPRHSVIVGTTNNDQFLADPTGNRRFWPISVSDTLNLELLGSWRDQLWAEAVVAVKAGERYWLNEEEDRQLAKLQRPHEEVHPWEELIAAWLDENGRKIGPELVTTSNLLEKAVKKLSGQWAKGEEMTLGQIMRRLGWDKTRKDRVFDENNHQVRVWKKRPALATDQEQAS